MITYLHWILLPLGTVYPLCTTTDGNACILPTTPQDSNKRTFDQCSSYKYGDMGSNDEPWCFTPFQTWGTCIPDCPGAQPDPNAYFAPGNKPGTCDFGIVNFPKMRIVNGFGARVGMFPWQVALLVKDSIYAQVCGGVLIGERHVLTAAHCVYDITKLYVLVGATDLAVKDEGRYTDYNGEIAPTGRKIFEVSETRTHPGYNIRDGKNDIAVLLLESKVDLSSYPNIKPITLSTEPVANFAQHELIIAGWGDTSFRGDARYLLQWNLVSLAQSCESNPDADQFCATGTTANGDIIDACTADSGGPIIALVQNEHGWSSVLIGLVKGGEGCAKNRHPGVYTDVYYHSQKYWLQHALFDAEGCHGPLPQPPNQQLSEMMSDIMKFAFPYFSGMTGRLMKIEKELNSLWIEIESQTGDIKRDLRKIDRELDTLKRIDRGTVSIYRDVRKIGKGTDSISRDVQKIKRKMKIW